MNTQVDKLSAGTPTGGTTGQVLTKNSNTDFDYDWGAGGVGGTNYGINTDPTATWWTIQVSQLGLNGSTVNQTVGSNAVVNYFGYRTYGPTAVNGASYSSGSLNVSSFSTNGVRAKFKFAATSVPSAVGDYFAVGCGSITYSGSCNGAGIRMANSTVYFVTGTGANEEVTDLTALGVSGTNFNLYSFQGDFTNGYTCYVNGVLKATHTTFVPVVFPNSEFVLDMIVSGGTPSSKLSPIIVSMPV